MRRVGLAIATFLAAWAVAAVPATAAVQPVWAALEIGPLFPQWRAIVGPFFASPPSVEHYTVVTEASGSPA